MKITLLGGGGIIGRVIARDLVENPRVTQVVLADLDVAAAQAVADGLGSSKVTWSARTSPTPLPSAPNWPTAAA